MSLPSQGSLLSFAEQPAKIGNAGTYDASTLDFFKVRVPTIVLGTMQDQQVFPAETGGPLTPTGTFKQGYFGVAQVDMIPRLEDSFGLILKGVMGSASTVTGKDSDGVTKIGVNTHIFRFDPANSAAQPWMAIRRMIPGASNPERFGESLFDAKINNLAINIPGAGKLAARFSLMARDVDYDDASTWVYENANFENHESAPDAGRGSLLFGGISYPMIGAAIEIANNLSTPQQEQIIGDFRMDDMIALSRSATLRVVYKYENSELYRLMLTGLENGTEWSSLPYLQNTAGSVYAFDATFASPGNIPTTAYPYRFRIRASRISWAVDGPPEMAAGDIITQAFTITILEPASGQDYLQLILENGAAAY